ncbi:MAG: sodium:solute symporter family protein [Bryobacterales bacterium]|nr:sodium:solute symporter family protein [Bryobacterales bacterium]
MVPTLFVALYLIAVLYIGIFAFRRGKPKDHQAEDFFLASRSLGGFVFLFSLFGTHMTAFAILGSSGHAFHNGIVTFGLMASSSAVVVPLLLFFVGTRLWWIGRQFGHMTPVQIFRDRWDCGHIGTVIFVAQALLLIPYIIIGVIGGGTALATISGGLVPYWLGGAVVALVVMSYVFFGGMRGTAWVNAFQTVLFLSFGTIAVSVIGYGMGGFSQAVANLESSQATSWLLTRERVPPLFFLSYTFIPLSAIAFPHIGIFCLTAKKLTQFKKTVIFYPICLLAIWLPCVFLGVAANSVSDSPAVRAKQEARTTLAQQGPKLPAAEQQRLRAQMVSDDILLVLLNKYAPIWLAGLLGAGIMAAVMASDSQILALSTMFTEDVFAYYGHKERFGEGAQVITGRVFIILVTTFAYVVAQWFPTNIFELASQYAFSGYAALSVLPIAAVYWKGSTKWGALAATLWTGFVVVAIGIFQSQATAPGVYWRIGELAVLTRTPAGTTVLGYMPVVPMTIGSAVLMVVVSLVTPKPARGTVERYFPSV